MLALSIGGYARLMMGKVRMVCRAGIVCAVVSVAAGTLAEAPDVGDEVVVFGDVQKLRHELRLAEEAVYHRFNDINSDDRFDIHCVNEEFLGSRIPRHTCRSNDWRDKASAHGQALLGEMRGESTLPPHLYLIQQQEGQRQLMREMRRLAVTDEQMALAMQRLGSAQRALKGPRWNGTQSRQVPPESYELPAEAARAFEVQIGKTPWVHGLEQRTFTVANVTGEIREFEAECPEGSKSIEYEQDREWTLPQSWGTCVLVVSAKRSTTFTLFEFAN